MKKSRPERNSDFVRLFFYGWSWLTALLALAYTVGGEFYRSFACCMAALVFYAMSFLGFGDID